MVTELTTGPNSHGVAARSAGAYEQGRREHQQGAVPQDPAEKQREVADRCHPHPFQYPLLFLDEGAEPAGRRP